MTLTPEEIKKYVPYWADLAERYNQSFEDFQWEHHRMEEMTTDAMIHILPLLTALATERKRVEELERVLSQCLKDAEYFSYRLDQLGIDHSWNNSPEFYSQALTQNSVGEVK